jgi:hypothetical protein
MALKATKITSVEQTKKKHNVVLIGVSHARGCAGMLQHKLKDQYVVTGFAKPGASLENLTNTVKKETSKLPKDDHLIFWGGANNVSRTPTSKSLTQIFGYLQETQHTNVTVISLPQ